MLNWPTIYNKCWAIWNGQLDIIWKCKLFVNTIVVQTFIGSMARSLKFLFYTKFYYWRLKTNSYVLKRLTKLLSFQARKPHLLRKCSAIAFATTIFQISSNWLLTRSQKLLPKRHSLGLINQFPMSCWEGEVYIDLMDFIPAFLFMIISIRKSILYWEIHRLMKQLLVTAAKK